MGSILQQLGHGRDPVLERSLLRAVAAMPSGATAGKPNPPCTGRVQASRLPQASCSISTAIRLPQLGPPRCWVQPWVAAPPANSCAGAQGAAAAAPPARASRGATAIPDLRIGPQMPCYRGRAVRVGGRGGAWCAKRGHPVPRTPPTLRTPSPSLLPVTIQMDAPEQSQQPASGGGGRRVGLGGGTSACSPVAHPRGPKAIGSSLGSAHLHDYSARYQGPPAKRLLPRCWSAWRERAGVNGM